jgi:hypothetical protein
VGSQLDDLNSAPIRFDDLDAALVACYEEAYRETIWTAAGHQPPTSLEVVDIVLEGRYPDTEVVVTTRDSRGRLDEQRFGLWDDTFQNPRGLVMGPSFLAAALVTQVFEEAAC